MLKYIEENIDKIQDANNVNVFYPQRSKHGISIYAGLVGGELVKLTSEQSLMTFPFEPFYWMAKSKNAPNILDRDYFEGFFKIYDDVCLNKEKFDKFSYMPNEKGIEVWASFVDGSSFALYTAKKSIIEKEKQRLADIVDIVKRNKLYEDEYSL